MSASDFARMKDMERRIALLEQEVVQLRAATIAKAIPEQDAVNAELDRRVGALEAKRARPNA